MKKSSQIKLTWLLLFLAAQSMAKPPADPKLEKWLKGTNQSRPNSIYIKFSGSNIANHKERDLIHKKIGAVNVTYRSKNFAIDVVTAIGLGAETTEARLREVCAAYQKETTIIFCEPDNWTIPAQEEKDCDPKTGQSLASQIMSALKNKDCEVVPLYGGQKLIQKQLSPFWAQELVGSDLAIQALGPIGDKLPAVKYGDIENFDVNSMPAARVASDLIDKVKKTTQEEKKFYEPKEYQLAMDGATSHGTLANNLVVGTFPVGTSLNAVYTVANSTTRMNANRIALGDEMIDKKVSIYGTSMLAENSYDGELIKKLREKNVIVVMAAGNDYPKTPHQEQTNNGIVVGSLSPIGVMSYFSSELKDVTIAAPSDGHITSSFKNKFLDFSGTSGARPVVTGSVANIVSLLPGVTQNEIKELLVRSAIQTANAHDSKKSNGKGMLNAYKMTRIAMRLRDDWPKNRKKIFEDAKIYDFNGESKETAATALNLLTNKEDCKQMKGMEHLRTAFLLDPKNLTLAGELAKVYRSQGLEVNALFYDSLKGVDLNFIKSAMTIEDQWIRAAALRSSVELGEQAWPIISASLKSKQPRELRAAIVAAYQLNKKKEAQAGLLNGLESMTDYKEILGWMKFGTSDLGFKVQIFEESCKKIPDEDIVYMCLAKIREES